MREWKALTAYNGERGEYRTLSGRVEVRSDDGAESVVLETHDAFDGSARQLAAAWLAGDV